MDDPHVGRFACPERNPPGIGQRDLLRFMRRMRGGGEEVEFRRLRGAGALEAHVVRAPGDVQRISRTKLERPAVHDDATRAAEIDEPEFAPAQESVCADWLQGFQRQRGGNRHGTAHDKSVDMAVGQHDLAGHEQRFDQEMAAQLIGGERLDGVGVTDMAHLHRRLSVQGQEITLRGCGRYGGCVHVSRSSLPLMSS